MARAGTYLAGSTDCKDDWHHRLQGDSVLFIYSNSLIRSEFVGSSIFIEEHLVHVILFGVFLSWENSVTILRYRTHHRNTVPTSLRRRV